MELSPCTLNANTWFSQINSAVLLIHTSVLIPFAYSDFFLRCVVLQWQGQWLIELLVQIVL